MVCTARTPTPPADPRCLGLSCRRVSLSSLRPADKLGEYPCEIVMRRYELLSTIITSNRPLEERGNLLGDVPTATANLDRLLHHPEMIQMTGRSCLLKDRALQKRHKIAD